MFKVNETNWDPIVGVVLGIILLVLGWGGIVTGGWGVFLKIIGFVPLLFGLIGYSPHYAFLKFGTKKVG
jgi:hypothetical protein